MEGLKITLWWPLEIKCSHKDCVETVKGKVKNGWEDFRAIGWNICGTGGGGVPLHGYCPDHFNDEPDPTLPVPDCEHHWTFIDWRTMPPLDKGIRKAWVLCSKCKIISEAEANYD